MSSKAENRNPTKEEDFPPERYPLDAIDHDYYPGEEDPYKCMTQEEKLRRIERLDNRAHTLQKLKDVYPNVELKTAEQMEELIEQYGQSKGKLEDDENRDSEKALNDTREQQKEDKNVPEK